MALDLNSYNSQQKFINNVLLKNQAVIKGQGYSGTAPNYDDLYIDNTEIATYAFTSKELTSPGNNAAAKEVFSFITSNNRLVTSLKLTRADYYILENNELSILSKYNSYHQQAMKAMATPAS